MAATQPTEHSESELVSVNLINVNLFHLVKSLLFPQYIMRLFPSRICKIMPVQIILYQYNEAFTLKYLQNNASPNNFILPISRLEKGSNRGIYMYEAERHLVITLSVVCLSVRPTVCSSVTLELLITFLP